MSNRPVVIIPARSGEPALGWAEACAEADGIAVDLGFEEAAVCCIGSVLGPVAARLGRGSVVVCCEAQSFEPARWAETLASECGEAQVVLLPGSADGRDLAVRLAAILRRPLHAQCSSISAVQVERPRYGSTLLERVPVAGPFVATLAPGARATETPAEQDMVQVRSIDLAPAVITAEPQLVALQTPDPATVGLSDARRIVGAGAGVMSKDDSVEVNRSRFEVLTQVGLACGAALGATRVVTDAGYVDHGRQIGSTGVVVDPDLYVAFGVAGAVQHTTGLGNPDHVISVNTDPHAPMMALADLAITTDAPRTIAALAAQLAERTTEPAARPELHQSITPGSEAAT